MEDVLNGHGAVGTALFVGGFVVFGLPFVTGRHRFLFSCLALGALMALLGAWLIDRWFAFLLIAFVAAVALALKIFVLRDDTYLKNYPVFAAAPFLTIKAKDGFEYRLHIAPVKSGFGIGMDFDIEPESGLTSLQTRWREIFPDRASAERELMRRAREHIGPDGMPDE